jgi:hypothetical protein
MNLEPLYEGIKKRLQLKTDFVPYIDMYNGQYEGDPGENDAYTVPAVFIEFEHGDPKSLGNRKQAVMVDVMVYIEDEQIQDLDSTSEDNIRHMGFEHMERVEQVHRALHGWTDNGAIGSLSRTDFSPGFTTRKGRIMHAMRYRCRYIDASAGINYKKVVPDPAQRIDVREE